MRYSFLCEGGEPEVRMQACLHIMVPGDRPSSGAEHEMTAEPPYRGCRFIYCDSLDYIAR